MDHIQVSYVSNPNNFNLNKMIRIGKIWPALMIMKQIQLSNE